MTRINAAISPHELTDRHLLAEHRECKRIPNMVRSGRCNLNNIPSKFCLGKGHVSWFYDKLGYLLERYKQIYAECKARGFNVQDYSSAWEGVPSSLMGNYTPSATDRQIVQARIASRLNS